ncbi:alpha/beta fold hydrolase [Hoeflea sp. G2-23]|uniref:Alpha/beta fold hydrolase n=1 Tax=Hoeflea algicola TaxID=2983763 RepID=A0ABT3Z912_9HYPH|nr:alpha/beta fold hydrolase [Hoeflea algicola]MCY0148232.1 alpha/beta fold hydrolase [Hoeflea algicola]
MNAVGGPTPLTQAIEAIYSYFKGEQEFTDFMQDLEDFLVVGETGHPDFSGEIETHFQIAAELAQVMAPAPEAKYRGLVEGPALKLVVDRAFRIVAQSAEARRIFGYLEGVGIKLDKSRQTIIADGEDLCTAEQIDQVRQHFSGAVVAGIALLFGQNEVPQPSRRSFIRTEGDGGFVSLTRDDALDVIVITLPGVSWSRNISVILAGSLGLSPSEIEVLELMAYGKSNVDISKERSRSVDTVKSQTQAIFRKLGVTSRVEAVQVVNDLISLAALSGEPFTPVSLEGPAPGNFPFAQDGSAWRRMTVEGRTVSYVHYPIDRRARQKRPPVLMFHGLLQSPELSPAIRQSLRQSGFELLGASKPGYGASDGPRRGTSFMHTCVDDALHLCDRHDAGPCLVLGHLFGAKAAIEFCLAYPERVRGLVLCSAYFPLQIADHLMPTGGLQKLAMSSGIASWAAHRFIALTAVSYLRYGGSRRYLSTLTEHSNGDRQAIRDPEIYGLLRAGIRHVTIGGASAFLADTSSSNSDWSNLLPMLNLPVVVLHGDSDPAVNPQLARIAASRIPGCRYEEVEGIGQHVLHARPDRVVAALEEVGAVAETAA